MPKDSLKRKRIDLIDLEDNDIENISQQVAQEREDILNENELNEIESAKVKDIIMHFFVKRDKTEISAENQNAHKSDPYTFRFVELKNADKIFWWDRPNISRGKEVISNLFSEQKSLFKKIMDEFEDDELRNMNHKKFIET